MNFKKMFRKLKSIRHRASVDHLISKIFFFFLVNWQTFGQNVWEFKMTWDIPVVSLVIGFYKTKSIPKIGLTYGQNIKTVIFKEA